MAGNSTTVRLNEGMRDRLLKALMGRKFDKRKEELKTELQVLARDIHQAAFTEADHREMERIRRERPDWIPTCNKVSIRLGTKDLELNLGTTLLVPHHKAAYGQDTVCLMVCGFEHVFTKRYNTIAEEQEDIKRQEDTLRSEIRHILSSTTTAGALINKWPEIKNLVDQICSVRTELVCISAPRIAALNATLGLKPVGV